MFPDEGTESWAWVDNSQTPQNGDQTIDNSVLGNSTSTQGPDQWTGFFKELVGAGFAYAIQKDAVSSGVTPRYTTQAGQPVYAGQAAPATGGISTKSLLLIGAIGVGLVLAWKA